MARVEGQSNSKSETGKNWRNIGLGLFAIGLLGIASLAVVGGGIALGGELYKRANTPKK
jgi:hypothetical protein